MLGRFVRSVGGAVQEGLNAAGDAAAAATGILGDLADGETPNKADIVKLGQAGWTVAEIASLYGVASHVIEEMSDA